MQKIIFSQPFRKIWHFPIMAILLALAGCATNTPGISSEPVRTEKPSAQAAKPDDAPQPPPSGPPASFTLTLTDALGKKLTGRVNLFNLTNGAREQMPVQEGLVTVTVPAAAYRCYTYVHYNTLPVLIDVRDTQVLEGTDNRVDISIVEGASPTASVLNFDADGDLAIDRVELDAGTDPYNAASIPGKPLIPFNSPVLSPKAAWYKGDLFCHSNYGEGTESVAQLIKRAEAAGLDFLAITDKNTMAAVEDSGYHSDKLVLIPALEWGYPEMGYALIYGPRTEPDPPSTVGMAQAECLRVQAQGGIFAIAHPCLPAAPWQWGLSYVNAVQVWLRDWRDAPPLALENLATPYQKRDEKGDLVYSIAAAAAASGLSANGQAAQFWDYELVRGTMSAAIGGSGSGSPKVPLGAPVTYVYAKEKSLEGILEGLRTGRTYISRDLNGPNLFVQADVNGDGSIEVAEPGGVVPTNNDVVFEVGVSKAAGKKLQVLLNGYPVLTKRIEGDMFVHRLHQHPDHYGAYRFRVIGGAEDPKDGFGFVDVYAMTSPIYAQNTTREMMLRNKIDASKSWIKVEPEFQNEVLPDLSVPPLNPVIME